MVQKIDVCPVGSSKVSFKSEDEGVLPVRGPGGCSLSSALSAVTFKAK